jgi:hypothetical protein
LFSAFEVQLSDSGIYWGKLKGLCKIMQMSFDEALKSQQQKNIVPQDEPVPSVASSVGYVPSLSFVPPIQNWFSSTSTGIARFSPRDVSLRPFLSLLFLIVVFSGYRTLKLAPAVYQDDTLVLTPNKQVPSRPSLASIFDEVQPLLPCAFPRLILKACST